MDGRWRQLYCLGCHGYFLETIGTPFRGKQVASDKLVWAMTTLAEGLGIRAVARVFEVDPHTVSSSHLIRYPYVSESSPR